MKTPQQIIEEFREKFPLNINRTIGWNTAMYYILALICERDEEWKEEMISKNLKGERNRVISMIRTEEQIKLREMIENIFTEFNEEFPNLHTVKGAIHKPVDVIGFLRKAFDKLE